LGKMPLVIQFNKRDLPDIRTEQELADLAARCEEPVYLAVATRGLGVVETLMGLLHLTWQTLDRTHQLSQKLSIDGDTLLVTAARELGGARPVRGMRAAGGGGRR